LADWDGDGRLDSHLQQHSWRSDVAQEHWHTHRAKLARPQPVGVEWNDTQPALAWGWRKPQGKALLTQWRTTPVVFDFNHDGLLDLAVLDQEGYLSFFERARVNGQFILKARGAPSWMSKVNRCDLTPRAPGRVDAASSASRIGTAMGNLIFC
jgi:hypothetical protein